MRLEWRQLPTKEICHVTACGRYSIGFDEQHQVWRTYRLAPGGPWFAQIAVAVDEQAAKAVAEGDAT